MTDISIDPPAVRALGQQLSDRSVDAPGTRQADWLDIDAVESSPGLTAGSASGACRDAWASRFRVIVGDMDATGEKLRDGAQVHEDYDAHAQDVIGAMLSSVREIAEWSAEVPVE